MGNQPSRPPTSSPHSPNVTQSGGPALYHDGASHAGFAAAANPRRRESIQALSAKASAAPPSASLAQTIATPAINSNSSTSAVTKQLRIAHDTLTSASQEKMGNEQSRHKGHHPRDPRDHHTTSTSSKGKTAAASEKPSPSPQTKPVDVPALPREDTTASRAEQASSSSLGPLSPSQASQDYIPPSQYSRPPRLPLPIEEEVHTPGSPIISPADLTSPIDIGEVDGVLPRPTSVLSSTTAEEDDLGDEFQGPQNVPTVPTLIEWEAPGERVYVTGTFAGWNRKYRLHRK